MIVIYIGIGFDNGLIIIHGVSCPHDVERIIIMNGEYFNGFNGLNLAACVLSSSAIEIEPINGHCQQQKRDDIDGAVTDVFDAPNSQINVNEIMWIENEKKNNKTIFDIVKMMVKIKEYYRIQRKEVHRPNKFNS